MTAHNRKVKKHKNLTRKRNNRTTNKRNRRTTNKRHRKITNKRHRKLAHKMFGGVDIDSPQTAVVAEPATATVVSEPATATDVAEPATATVVAEPTTATVVSEPATATIVSEPAATSPATTSTIKKIDEQLKSELSSKLMNPSQNLGKMLSVMCKDPDNCLAIGKYIPMMKAFFEDFRNLSLVNMNEIKRIGKPSKNGFIFEIPFKKNGYTSYTVLKSSANPSADNLFYEYYVGKTFINKYIKQFPIFVETYDCYRYNSIVLANLFKRISEGLVKFRDTGITDLGTVITPIKHGDLNNKMELRKLFEDSCIDSDTICILIQHFNNLISFNTFFNPTTPGYQENKFDGPYLLYQLYFTLSVLGNKYTHYDLHADNVYVYKPYQGEKYILMRFHSKGKIYEFPSEYIVKLIDYGRNYINNGYKTTKEIMSDIICIAINCMPYCGEQYGYSVIQGDPHFYNIDPVTPNESHDLRAFVQLNRARMPDLWKGRIYKDDVYYESTYGTPQNLTGDSNHIRSIHDLREALENNAFNVYDAEMKKKYKTWTKVAEMDIYDDGREYEFRDV